MRSRNDALAERDALSGQVADHAAAVLDARKRLRAAQVTTNRALAPTRAVERVRLRRMTRALLDS